MNDDSLTVYARAKINLYLDVVGRLPNGYHAVETLYQSIDLGDVLHCRRTADETTIECDDPSVPRGPDNLIVAAADLFRRFTGIRGGLAVRLEKVVPMGGGLGGASADAAATLVAMNRLYRTYLPLDTLERLGTGLGVDVPFCVRGGTCWAYGTGTRLRSRESLGSYPVVLVNPGLHVDTGSAYAGLNERRWVRPSRQLSLTGLERGDKILRGWRKALSGARTSDGPCASVHNCFEAALFRSHPAIRSARDALRDLGAIALVSGSGASVFGVFALLSEAVSAEQTLRGRYAFVARTAIAQSGVRLDFE